MTSTYARLSNIRGHNRMSVAERLFWQQKRSEYRAARETHRWSIGERVAVGPQGEEIEITGLWWQGNEAGYDVKRPGLPGEKRVKQSEIEGRTRGTDHQKHRHRDTRNAALLAKVQPPSLESQFSVKKSSQPVLRPLGSFCVINGVPIHYASTGLRYVH